MNRRWNNVPCLKLKYCLKTFDILSNFPLWIIIIFLGVATVLHGLMSRHSVGYLFTIESEFMDMMIKAIQ